MGIGMPYEEFWHGDPDAPLLYKRAWEVKKMNDNYFAWLKGLYDYRAMQAVESQLIYDFNGHKGAKPLEYIESPIPITDIEEEQERQKRIEKTRRFVEEGMKNGSNGH